jgi:hypothetical protein
MNKSVEEVLSLAEDDAQLMEETARKFEQFAASLNNHEEKVEFELLAAGYRERAQVIQRIIRKVRESFGTDVPRHDG